MTPVMKNLTERRSVRSYTDQCPTHEQLEQIVLAGQYAPSGMNLQEWHFLVVENPAATRRLAALMGQELGRPDYDLYGAPVIILAANKKDNRNAMADCCAALQNMMLAGHDLGLASCWINQFRDLWGNPRVEACLAELGLPQGYAVQCSAIFGYAAETRAPHERKPGTVTYVK